MELLTHGGEHHEIDDGGWLMMVMPSIPPLRSPERTPDLPSRGRIGGGGGSVSWNAMNSSPWFFLSGCEYIELELWSEEVQGAHKDGWSAPGGGRAPHPCGQGVGPLHLILSPIFFINSKNILREVSGHSENFYFCTKITPRQFCWKQCQSGLVPFKSCKLESKTRAKDFRKVDTMETYQIPQA